MNRMHDLKLTTAEVHDLIRGMILHESGNMQLSHAVNASKDKHKILQSVYDFQFNDALYPEHDYGAVSIDKIRYAFWFEEKSDGSVTICVSQIDEFS